MRYLVLLFLMTAPSVQALKPYQITARTFFESIKDRGFRREVNSISKDEPFSFYHFTDLYWKEESALNKMKIMKDYYNGHCREAYRLLSLTLFYNAYFPPTKPKDRLLYDFIQAHFLEPDVVGLFLYRYVSIALDAGASFARLYQNLIRKCRGFHFVELEALHFLDLMIVQEMNPDNYPALQDLLKQIWQAQKIQTSDLYLLYKPWFHKVISFYSLAGRTDGVFHADFPRFLKMRQTLFEQGGFTEASIIFALEKRFVLPEESRDLPAWLPEWEDNREWKNHQIETKSNKPLIIPNEFDDKYSERENSHESEKTK